MITTFITYISKKKTNCEIVSTLDQDLNWNSAFRAVGSVRYTIALLLITHTTEKIGVIPQYTSITEISLLIFD